MGADTCKASATLTNEFVFDPSNPTSEHQSVRSSSPTFNPIQKKKMILTLNSMPNQVGRERKNSENRGPKLIYSHRDSPSLEKDLRPRKKTASAIRQKISGKQNCTYLHNQEQDINSLALFTFKDPLKELKGAENIAEDSADLSSHRFPQKALFRQRKKVPKESDDSHLLKELVIKKTVSLQQCDNELDSEREIDLKSEETEGQSHENTEKDGKQEEKEEEDLLRSFRPSLNMVQVQIDQETSVCEIRNDQSEYLFQLINMRKESKCELTPEDDSRSKC